MQSNKLIAKFIVGEKEIDPSSICFHHQDLPRPGGFEYSIEVFIENKSVISFLESMVGCTIDNKKFIELVGRSGNSAFNSVNWILNVMDLPPSKVDWVFNTIDQAKINNSMLIITGRCSKFTDYFDSTNKTSLF